MSVNLIDMAKKMKSAIKEEFRFNLGIVGSVPDLFAPEHIDTRSMTLATMRKNILFHEKYLTGLQDMTHEDQVVVFGLSSFMVNMQIVNKCLQDEGINLNTLYEMSVFDYYELLKNGFTPSIVTPGEIDQSKRILYHSLVMALNSVLSYLDRSHDKYISEGPENGQEAN